MTNFRRRILIRAFVLFDLGTLATSYMLISVWHAEGLHSFASLITVRVNLLDIVVALGLVAIWHLMFSAFGLYRSKRLGNRWREAEDVLKATGLAAVALRLALAIVRTPTIKLSLVAVFWAISSAVLILCRLLMRGLLARVRIHGRNLRNVLIVGTNARAVELGHALDSRPELGYQLLGFADEQWWGNNELWENGKSIVTSLDQFTDFIRKRVVDEVIIALPMKSFYSTAASIIAGCQQQGVIVRVLTNIFDLQQRDITSGELDSSDLATYSNNRGEGWPMVCKRLLDILISSLLLIVLAPLCVIVALLVKLDSSGPVLFVQERVGLNKRRFRMYKFRTMVADAEKRQAELECLNAADGPVFKIKKDPRITRLGSFLRKTSIDELPQLLNVIRGHMSLVGPRPLPVRDYQKFDQDWQRRRFSARPGITCLWQVSGRSDISFDRWMDLDMQYIDEWSVWLDLKILVRTIPAVFKSVGAI